MIPRQGRAPAYLFVVGDVGRLEHFLEHAVRQEAVREQQLVILLVRHTVVFLLLLLLLGVLAAACCGNNVVNAR